MNNPVCQLRLGYALGRFRAGLAMRAIWEEEPEPILAKRTQPSLNMGGVLFRTRPSCAHAEGSSNTTFRCIMMLCNYFATFSAKPKRQNAKMRKQSQRAAQTNPTARTAVKTMFEYERYNH